MTQALTTKLQSFFATQPVEKAWVFGSFSRGEETVRLERILAEENA